MKEIKMIAIDLDGTLVPFSGNHISEENIQALEQARKKGVRVVINTGRPPEYCWQVTDVLKFEGELITNCGSRIFEMPQRKTILKNVIPVQSAQKFIDYAEQQGLITMVCAIDKAYIRKSDVAKLRAFEGHVHQNGTFHNIIEDYQTVFEGYPEDIDKMEAFATKAELDEVERYIAQNLPSLMCARTGSQVLEIYSVKAGKGNGLKKLAESLNISHENVMAIGDSGNDLHMFEYAGLAVAMGNSPAHIASKCDYVTSDVTEHGVAKAIDTFILS